MKKSLLLIAFLSIVIMGGLAQNPDDGTEVSVDVQRACLTSANSFDFTATNVQGPDGFPLIGTGGVGYFNYFPFNDGEMAYVEEDILYYEYYPGNNSQGSRITTPNQSFSDSYLFNSTNWDADSSVSRLLGEDESVYRAPYWYDLSFDDWGNSRPQGITKVQEFIASRNFESGVYEAELETNFTCEFDPKDSSSVTNISAGNSINFSDLGDPSQSEISKYLEVDGINVTRLEKNGGGEDYARSEKFEKRYQDQFRVVTVEGNGSTPDEIADVNRSIGRQLETDADDVSNFTKNASLDKNINESFNSSREVDIDANQTSNLSKNASLDTDVNRTSNLTKNSSLDSDAEKKKDSTPVEGDSAQPGQTPEPEPEPEPEPVPEPEPTPLLSVNMRPLNTTYTTPKGQFKEVGMEVTNTGEETISDLELSPRFSEGMDWEAQSVNIGSLGVNKTIEENVFVQAGESVDPGIYQIPVFATNGSTDISSEYVNVEVTEEVIRSELAITEAPQDIRFEVNSSYTVPVLLENAGNETLENVQIELQNAEDCGDYTADQIESVAAGETASVSVDFQTSDALDECEATIVASSDSGSFAFSEMNVETVEEKGIVPQEFRVPIIASLWTFMLIIYTVVFKRYGLDSVTVKLPLIVLIAGEVFLLVYLSSTYYGILPPGLLPFSSA